MHRALWMCSISSKKCSQHASEYHWRCTKSADRHIVWPLLSNCRPIIMRWWIDYANGKWCCRFVLPVIWSSLLIHPITYTCCWCFYGVDSIKFVDVFFYGILFVLSLWRDQFIVCAQFLFVFGVIAAYCVLVGRGGRGIVVFICFVIDAMEESITIDYKYIEPGTLKFENLFPVHNDQISHFGQNNYRISLVILTFSI